MAGGGYIAGMTKTRNLTSRSTGNGKSAAGTAGAPKSGGWTVKGGGAATTVKSAASGRFLSVASAALKPVTKQASISGAQADKAVRTYLETANK